MGGIDPFAFPAESELPMMANVDDILVKHFVLQLSCDLDKQTLSGSITLFLAPNPNATKGSKIKSNKSKSPGSSGSKNFELVLDHSQLSVTSVEEIKVPETQLKQTFDCSPVNFKQKLPHYKKCLDSPSSPLKFRTEEWCIKIHKPGVNSADNFPRVVRISYRIPPHGGKGGVSNDSPSVTWARDQDGMPCVFTQGSSVNNRGLFPCQDAPHVTSTWEAHIEHSSAVVCLMTGEANAKIEAKPETKGKSNSSPANSFGNAVRSYYHSTVPLPHACIAIAVGHWEEAGVVDINLDVYLDKFEPKQLYLPSDGCGHEPYPCRLAALKTKDTSLVKRCPVVPLRMFGPKSLILRFTTEISGYAVRALHGCHLNLGSHPFPRLDLLLVPKCFRGLGLASPCLIFLSQSLLANDMSMCLRVAHEVTHSWFGLLVGAKDPTEEWLTEGFCSYMEDFLHASVETFEPASNPEMPKHWQELKALLRFRQLRDEMANTPAELQTLRPGGGNSKQVLKNALNPYKPYTQVHYLKGYFLLRHLASLVGQEKFIDMLGKYVQQFHGQQVKSQDFLHFFFSTFKDAPAGQGGLQGKISMAEIMNEWLDKPGMPPKLEKFETSVNEKNELIESVKKEVKKWRMQNDQNLKYEREPAAMPHHKKKQKTGSSFSPNTSLSQDQVSLLLDYLLEENLLAHKTLCSLRSTFKLHNCNAEVRHRWCELVIKHSYVQGYPDVSKFLCDDQGMGVYLYSQLLSGKSHNQMELAEQCFGNTSHEMDAETRKFIEELIADCKQKIDSGVMGIASPPIKSLTSMMSSSMSSTDALGSPSSTMGTPMEMTMSP